MLYTVLALFLILGYAGSLASRMMTPHNGQLLGALLFLVPLAGFIVTFGLFEGFLQIVIWGYAAVILCPIGAGMGLCSCRRRAH